MGSIGVGEKLKLLYITYDIINKVDTFYNTCGICFFCGRIILMWPLAVFLSSHLATSSSDLLTKREKGGGESSCGGHTDVSPLSEAVLNDTIPAKLQKRASNELRAQLDGDHCGPKRWGSQFGSGPYFKNSLIFKVETIVMSHLKPSFSQFFVPTLIPHPSKWRTPSLKFPPPFNY